MLNEKRKLPPKILIEVEVGDVLTFKGHVTSWNQNDRTLCQAFINSYPGYHWSYVPNDGVTHLFKIKPEYQVPRVEDRW